MKSINFKAYVRLDLRRFFKPLKLWIFLLVLAVCLYFVQDGIWNYKGIVESKTEFQNIEQVNVKKFTNYTQYGLYGFRLLFIPSPLSVLFSHTGIISDLTAFVDSGARLRINKSILGKNLYVENNNGFNDFAGFTFFVITITSLFWGYGTFRHPKFLKLLASISRYWKIYFAYVGAKFFVFFLVIVVIGLFALFLMLLNNVYLSQDEFVNIFVFLGLTVMVAVFFFLLGTIAGSFQSKTTGFIAMISAWFVLMVLIPGVITKFIAKRADTITSSYNIEQRKLKLLMEFEKFARNEGQRYTSMEEKTRQERDLIEGYWKNEFKKIQAIEKKMQEEMMDNLIYYRWLTVFFPTTFYQAAANEIGSKGYTNFFNFYERTQQLHAKFVRYYFNKKFYSNYSEVEPFIKGDENVFYGQTWRPENILWGICLTFIYCGILAFISLYRFKRTIYSFPANWQTGLKNPTLKMKKGELRIFYVEDERFSHQLYNLLAGQHIDFKMNGFIDKIYIDDIDIGSFILRDEFLFLGRFEKMPGDLRGCDLINLIQGIFPKTPCSWKTLDHMSREDKENLYLAILKNKKSDIYLIDDIGKGMPIKFILDLKKQMEILSREGALVIYLTTDYQPSVISLRKEETFFNHSRWLDVVESLDGIT